MSKLRLEIGEYTPEPPPPPTVKMWLEQLGQSYNLVLRHSQDSMEQRLFSFEMRDGKIAVSMQEICAAQLCDAFGIEQKSTPPIKRWGYKSILLSSQSRADLDAVQAKGAPPPEAPVERDWATEVWVAMLEARDRNEAIAVIRNLCQPRGLAKTLDHEWLRERVVQIVSSCGIEPNGVPIGAVDLLADTIKEASNG